MQCEFESHRGHQKIAASNLFHAASTDCAEWVRPHGSLFRNVNAIAYVGAAVSVAAGLAGLLWPFQVSATIGLQLPSPLGLSEFRATYGGLFIGAGLAVLILGSRDAALVLGAAWLGAFLARAMSTLVDRSTSKENLAGLVVEAAIGTTLVFG